MGVSALRPLLLSGLASAAVLFGCSESPPSAALRATPNGGVAPFAVELDASESAGPTGQRLRARFDFDGDGAYDTEFTEALRAPHTYETPGQFQARVEVRDEDGRVAEASASIEVAVNEPPMPELAVEPSSGRAPLRIRADARASSDPNEAASALLARFDFDGDGVFESAVSPEKMAEFTFEEPGTYEVTVEVTDSRGSSRLVRRSVIVLPSADIDVDSNRDGVVDSEDDALEAAWTSERGAVFVANLDDDDGDGDRDSEDRALSGTSDSLDLAPIVLRRYPGLSPTARVTLSVAPAASRQVRVFAENNGQIAELLAPGALSAEIAPERLAAGNVRLFIEALEGRTSSWDGSVLLTLSIVDGDGEPQEDTVALRCAPVLFPDNTLPAQTLYVMRIDDPRLGENTPFFEALTRLIPPGVSIYAVDQYEYRGDRWVQDNMQTGYQALPVPGGVHYVNTFLETQRATGEDGLEYFVTRELLGEDMGYAFPGGRETSLNYGGNLEVSPAVTVGEALYPFGRVLIGGGELGLLDGGALERRMTPRQRSWLDAQAQGSAIEVSTEWLVVGHIDEIMQIVPDASSARGWKVVLASPALARRSLEALVQNGGGNRPVFAGRASETTARALLEDTELMVANDAAQARIDTVREGLTRGLGLSDEDFVEVPVLVEILNYDGDNLAVALNPGIQNLITVNQTLFVPDPEGPDGDRGDIWQADTRAALEPLGLTVHFVDVFESYHENLGEAHCGSGVLHSPHPKAWWTEERTGR